MFVYFQLKKEKTPSKTKEQLNKTQEGSDNEEVEGADHDPHFEPIVPLPDAIVVTTGEEEENVVFNERAKLFRYDNSTKEWKERGVGELKVLFHPENKTYRWVNFFSPIRNCKYIAVNWFQTAFETRTSTQTGFESTNHI